MAGKRKSFPVEGIMLYLLIIGISRCSGKDTILQGQQLHDWELLVSASGYFKLGFFSPGKSSFRFLGICFNFEKRTGYYPGYFAVPDQRPVWIANRDNPLYDTSGYLAIDAYGKLKIAYNEGNLMDLSSRQVRGNVSATLLDSGNFVLKELNVNGSIKEIIWQSFDYPTDTLLPGMKLGINFRTGHKWSLTSWVSEDVPASGSFTFGGDPNGTSQVVIWWHGDIYWTSGAWKNQCFEFIPNNFPYNDHPRVTYVSNEDERYLTFSENISGSLVGYRISRNGYVFDNMAELFSICFRIAPGCVMQKLPECRNLKHDWFETRRAYIWGDSYEIDRSNNISDYDCQLRCWNNCSCVACASIAEDNTGCQLWSHGVHIVDGGREVYILRSGKAKKWRIRLVLAVAAAVLTATGSLCIILLRRRKSKEQVGSKEEQQILLELGADTPFVHDHSKYRRQKTNDKSSNYLQIFSYESLETATENFAITNKLGEGGFGPVFKGKLDDGREIAIKRLSSSSGQGLMEFKNEIIVIAKLQHTNLVRLIGCCIKREEKMLVYEYMPNKSLDSFLFDPKKKTMLDWKKRLNIIEGVAQGLLYLHRYSRLKIVHRDLKASNILLDDEMNPKISDFGMARIFGRHDTEANTNRVVGTYGYMSPEYAMEGVFSMKSDVFSFGVLLLEIVSGNKNTGYYNSERPLNLIGYAWELWNEGRVTQLIDPTISDSCNPDEVLRHIHVGLLCVQDSPADRPTMSEVLTMISNESTPLSTPKQPAFFIGRRFVEENRTLKVSEKHSLNEVTISLMEAR